MGQEVGLGDTVIIPRRSQRFVTKDILVLHHSRHGSMRALVEVIVQGIESINGTRARVRTVSTVSTMCEATRPDVSGNGPPYVEISDLEECIGLALGSPTHFGNMAAPLKRFLDDTTPQWLAGALAGKPIYMFASAGSVHGGQRTTLLSTMLLLLHHGMVIPGLPYQHSGLLSIETGGMSYGPSHVAHRGDTAPLTARERTLAAAMGRRLAQTVLKLAA